MKEITFFMMDVCPYCIQAQKWLDELMAENPAYREIPMKVIDERKEPDIAGQYDYYLVPTFFVEGKKLHEGAATKAKIKEVLQQALEG
jgi:predicted DsbA family dithiol-disulfide isomerase